MIDSKQKVLWAIEGIVGGPYNGFKDGADTPTNYAEYVEAVIDGVTPFTEEEMEAGLVKCNSLWDAKQAKTAKREEIKSEWESLPDWITGPYQMQFAAANQLLDQGKVSSAIQMINYEEPKPGYNAEQKATFEAVKARMIGLMQGL